MVGKAVMYISDYGFGKDILLIRRLPAIREIAKWRGRICADRQPWLPANRTVLFLPRLSSGAFASSRAA